MAKCHRSNVGSTILNHRHPAKNTAGGHFRIWKSSSASSFRHIIFNAISCGRNSRHRHHQFDDDEINSAASTTNNREKRYVQNQRTEKLSDLLNIAEYETEAEEKKKEEALAELIQTVKELRGEDSTKRRIAAARVRSLTKENSEARGTLAMLGAIPPLVGMIDSEDIHSQIASLYALLNLGIGNDANKAATVKLGAVHKMLKLTESPDSADSSVCEAIVANFLGLSALDSNKPIIGSSGAIPFLVRILQSFLGNRSSSQVKQDALRALYNLSIIQTNIAFILETDLVSFLISSIGDMKVSERILSILSNLVSIPEGRKAISAVSDAISILVDVLNWTDSSECQEKALYILMIIAHKNYADRQVMIEAGIVSSLLELTLLGTTLVQKRASRILQFLRVDKGKQVSAEFGLTISAPMSCASSSSYLMEGEKDMMSEEKKAVKQLVQQSLQNNEENCQESQFASRFCSFRAFYFTHFLFNFKEPTILAIASLSYNNTLWFWSCNYVSSTDVMAIVS